MHKKLLNISICGYLVSSKTWNHKLSVVRKNKPNQTEPNQMLSTRSGPVFNTMFVVPLLGKFSETIRFFSFGFEMSSINDRYAMTFSIELIGKLMTIRMWMRVRACEQ